MVKKKQARKKEKTYVCVVCSKKKRGTKTMKCCNRNMLTKDKVWPD